MSSANDPNVPTGTSSTGSDNSNNCSNKPATPAPPPPLVLTRSNTDTSTSKSVPLSTSLSRSATERIVPPTSGSALLQFVAAALRSEGLGALGSRPDVSEEDDDLVLVKNDSKANKRPSLISRRSLHALGIQSDHEADTSEGSSDEDDEDDSSSSVVDGAARPHLQREKSHHHTRSEQGDMSKSESAISFGSFRDSKSIAEKLRSAFGYSEMEDFLGEYSCWLARSVLLPGYMYLTTNHICFYANLPSSQDVVQKEGYFSKKSRTYKRYYRYWFVLKNDFLSYYNNQTDVYYPIKTIDLKHALSAEPSPSNEETFYIFTNNKKYTFKTDSVIQRADWVKAIQKCIFHAKMEGDKVKISIPVANVVDVDMNRMAFAEAIQIKVMESDESFAVDEYYFAYFNDTARALAALKDQQRDYQSRHGKGSPQYEKIYDSTSPHVLSPRKTSPTTFTSRTEASPHQAAGSASTGLSASRSLLQSPRRLLHPITAVGSKVRSRSSSPSRGGPRSPRSQPTSDTEDSEKEKRSSLSLGLSFSIKGTTSWIQEHTPDFFGGEDSGTPLTEKEQATFRQEFGLPETEGLVAVVSGSLLRVVPLYGRIYLSDNYICYKSRVYVTETKVTVPLADINQVERHKGTLLFSHGMSLLTKTNKEFFFEFSTVETRNTIMNTLKDRTSPEAQARRQKQRARQLLETPSAELDDPMEARVMESLQLHEEPVHVEPWAQPSFKPSRPLHITCLTIGSRGDVQPYIALCKRFMQDGHTCRIATHAEYKDWIEGHGIEFGLVGGDPGELIELCVENGMFTVSFFREGMKRFRGWLDELMLTAWQACQNTDVLIESPSAMAGIHIAERLDIPYFRAFPFPWTRTRAFPHPFAVPEHKLGRGYNYMTYVMIEQVFWKGIAGQINRWRRKTLGLPPTSLERMEAHRVPFLYAWSPHVLPAPIDWSTWIHVTGYWFLDNPDHHWSPPEDLMAFLKADPNKKPVYIGFGSMVVADPDEMTRTIIDAVVKSGVRAIISKGWSDRVTPHAEGQQAQGAVKKEADRIEIPDSVYMIKSVPHDWLFPQLAGVVHHGGAGTVAAGLRAGVPTVIKPFFGDQFFWAQRVEEAGVGVWCHDLTVRKLTAALTAITTDEKMIKRAQMMGEKIRSEDGVGKAVEMFYHDLAEAKQRSNKLRKENSQHMQLQQQLQMQQQQQQHGSSGKNGSDEFTPMKFNVHEGEDDWWFVQPSKSGAASGDGSDSTAGLNVLSGSDEESVTPTPTEDRRSVFRLSGGPAVAGVQHAQTMTGVNVSQKVGSSSDK
ncbi:Sterol 3-beta-glucosyltransferase [Actinomortierella ambigua]|nr:Sterol 3-beta-glucosyltransferase [Actinomortierella ambigua]